MLHLPTKGNESIYRKPSKNYQAKTALPSHTLSYLLQSFDLGSFVQ